MNPETRKPLLIYSHRIEDLEHRNNRQILLDWMREQGIDPEEVVAHTLFITDTAFADVYSLVYFTFDLDENGRKMRDQAGNSVQRLNLRYVSTIPDTDQEYFYE